MNHTQELATEIPPAPAMRRAALIYNPVSGQYSSRRMMRIAEVLAILQDAGVDVEAIATESPDSAGRLALDAVKRGCDTILACGGDGTLHETLQCLVGQSASLGVIPMGTANAFAADLGLPGSPVKAAKLLLTASPQRVSVGRVSFVDMEGKPRSRYFVVAAGVGLDAQFFAGLDSQFKQRFGYVAYLVEALRLWAMTKFPTFAARFEETGSIAPRQVEASQVLAVRISNFGGLVQNLVPGAALNNSSLRVIAFKTRSRLRYMRFMAAVWFRRHTYSDTIELVDCHSVECRSLEGSSPRLLVEADGELLGTLPVRIEVIPDALNVLIPSKTLSRRGMPATADAISTSA